MNTVARTASAGTSGLQPQLMEIAGTGDRLDDDSVAPLRAFLNDQIAALNDDLKKANSQKLIDKVQALQARLAAKATALTGLSIQLLTGEASVIAEQIKSTVDTARQVVDKVKSLKTKLTQLGAVIDFAAAVLTGNVGTIVQGAEALEAALK